MARLIIKTLNDKTGMIRIKYVCKPEQTIKVNQIKTATKKFQTI